MSKIIKNVKSIRFNANFKGDGCVNYDSNDQKYVNGVITCGNDNFAFAKKVFKPNSTDFKYKVSSECLRHNVFATAIPFDDTVIQSLNPDIINATVARLDYILRGYCLASSGIKKSTSLMMTDAVADMEWETSPSKNITMCTKMVEKKIGKKDKDKDDKDKKSSNSMYKIERPGMLTYTSTCAINLLELQFISFDGRFDRQAAIGHNDKELKSYLSTLQNQTGETYTVDEYKMVGTSETAFERGIVLSKETVNTLVHKLISNIKSVNIIKRASYLQFESISSIICVCANGEEIELAPEELDDVVFEYEQSYETIA